MMSVYAEPKGQQYRGRREGPGHLRGQYRQQERKEGGFLPGYISKTLTCSYCHRPIVTGIAFSYIASTGCVR